MECISCGATLRPGARFCNVCGARQDLPGEAVATAVRERVESPADVLDTTTTTGAGAADVARDEGGTQPAIATGTKVPRPARVPRRRDATVSDETVTGEARPKVDEHETRPETVAAKPEDLDATEPVTFPQGYATSDEADTAEVATLPTAAPVAPSDIAEIPTAAPASPPDIEEIPTAAPAPTTIEDADTQEYVALQGTSAPLPPLDAMNGALGGGPSTSEPGMSLPSDGLPWPLPPALIVGGRYRVEEFIQGGRDEAGLLNVYVVRDLQGYERCWSCGARPDVASAADPYCPECGADMLAREFIMMERVAPYDVPPPPTPDARFFTWGMRAYVVTPQPVHEVRFPRGVRVSASAAADAGLAKGASPNEDSVGVFVFDTAFNSYHAPIAVGIVADGLGGHVSGQKASQLVVRTLMDGVLRRLAPRHLASDSPRDAMPDAGEVLMQASREANRTLCEENEEARVDMGSTVVAALIAGDTAYVANMGDSRAYAFDIAGLRRITKDHSLVEQLVDAGMITDAERYEHPNRNQVFKSLGTEADMDVDLFTQQLRPGMRILLCSDGVWEMVRDAEIEAILREAPGPQETCERLVRAANDNGGADNISAVVLQISS